MKKILFILAFVYTAFSYGQGGPKVDAIKFKGDISTTVRNTIDVPVGETWLIWNTTTGQFEYSESDDTWYDLQGITDGSNSTTFFQISTQALNKIEIGESGPVGATDYVRIAGGETTGQAPILYITDNYAAISNYDNTDIDAVGATSLITKAYGDANYGSGGVTDGDKGEIVVSGGVWSIDTNAVSLGNMADNSITEAEIIDGTVIEADLNISNTPTVNYALTSDGSTGFTWTNPSSFIGVGSILEDKLNIDNAPTDNYILAYNQPSLNFKWVDPATLGGGSSPPFDDNSALVRNNIDTSKLLDFDLSGLTTATTRTLTMPDADVNLGNMVTTNTVQSITGQKSFISSPNIESEINFNAHSDGSGSSAYSEFGVDANEYWYLESTEASGISAKLNLTGLTAERTFVFPDASGTVALTSNITDDQTASEVNITDSAANYTGTTVEAALTEIADSLAVQITSDITGVTGGTAIKNMYLQTEAGQDTDGDPPTGVASLCIDCSPAKVVATATIAMDG